MHEKELIIIQLKKEINDEKIFISEKQLEEEEIKNKIKIVENKNEKIGNLKNKLELS